AEILMGDGMACDRDPAAAGQLLNLAPGEQFIRKPHRFAISPVRDNKDRPGNARLREDWPRVPDGGPDTVIEGDRQLVRPSAGTGDLGGRDETIALLQRQFDVLAEACWGYVAVAPRGGADRVVAENSPSHRGPRSV